MFHTVTLFFCRFISEKLPFVSLSTERTVAHVLSKCVRAKWTDLFRDHGTPVIDAVSQRPISYPSQTAWDIKRRRVTDQHADTCVHAVNLTRACQLYSYHADDDDTAGTAVAQRRVTNYSSTHACRHYKL